MAYAVVDRPAWKEVTGVVLVCVVLLVGLVRLDRAGYEGAMDDARKAIAAQQAAQRARQAPSAGTRSGAPAYQPAPRTESLGDRGPIVLPVGRAWSGGTVVTVPDVARHSRRAPPPTGALRRITGPAVPEDVATGSDAAQATSRTRTPPPPRPRATAPPAAAPAAAMPVRGQHPWNVLVALLAGVGVVLVAAGGVLIGRGR